MIIRNFTKFAFIAIFALSINAEYKLGKDYRLVDNPLPVKKDGIVEVTESFWYGCLHVMLLNRLLIVGLQNKDQM